MKNKLFSYQIMDTPIHRLSGLTKLIAFLFLTFAVMFSYDTRVIAFMIVFSMYLLRISKITFKQIKIMVIYVAAFVLTNAVITYLFSPELGVQLYGTRHELFTIVGRYTVTAEQLFYQGTKLMKYVSVVPFGIMFLLTTNPSEFASSLNRIGVPYKAATAVALTLRYFPDVQRDYNNISQAQQARGLDLSHKAPLKERFKNALLIVVPLIFSTLDRIELISNAMDLRGFGKHKRRTWYTTKKMTKEDGVALAVSIGLFALSISVSLFINHSRFYNPFL
ncbi:MULTISPECIES: energy-coupling factor transporter transmembrane protein EcfT [unclassified Fusibacter]|uniref:energy-coupling factor transporter transmembrane component T family protein n=1 Tax=unclassified Fusibacter TaxID=2624464 RepID=UPI00101244E1|nr:MULTISPECIES: energy-coupling factor transporter transmembrane component T [unclassified Fusibacter]MCK8059680.1 energy-coupling factor transporter transmembrane protein EcfT [Fusibacter sp. A2]NPE21481.1 energy-coupling factor transporter transmembrane protein EcfT [Fusibacter sp. A1]RXV61892.1 energy-coupling factor transporter transmembrane protein EcfT [Fusibacter sp. A1]